MALWEPGYAAARRALLLSARTLPDALAQVRPFLDPLLDDAAIGVWNPEDEKWSI
jgi:hypothetical protein